MKNQCFSGIRFLMTVSGAALFLWLAAAFSVRAEENSISFTIAPPPVGYPRLIPKTGYAQAGGDVLFLSLDVMEEKVYLFGGLQANISAGPLIISPFGIASYALGAFRTTQTSTMSYEYPSVSGTTSEPAGTVIGIDVLYVPRTIPKFPTPPYRQLYPHLGGSEVDAEK